MTLRVQRYLIIGGAVVLGIVVGVVVMYRQVGQQSGQQPATTIAPIVPSPAEVEAKYRQGLNQVTGVLRPLLAKQLTATDEPQVAKVEASLAKLLVPVSAQGFHLSLVLKVSLLDELLSPRRVTIASANGPTVAGTVHDLQQLLSQVQ